MYYSILITIIFLAKSVVYVILVHYLLSLYLVFLIITDSIVIR